MRPIATAAAILLFALAGCDRDAPPGAQTDIQAQIDGERGDPTKMRMLPPMAMGDWAPNQVPIIKQARGSRWFIFPYQPSNDVQYGAQWVDVILDPATFTLTESMLKGSIPLDNLSNVTVKDGRLIVTPDRTGIVGEMDIRAMRSAFSQSRIPWTEGGQGRTVRNEVVVDTGNGRPMAATYQSTTGGSPLVDPTTGQINADVLRETVTKVQQRALDSGVSVQPNTATTPAGAGK